MNQGNKRYSITSMKHSKFKQQNTKLHNSLVSNHQDKKIRVISNLRNTQTIRGFKSKSVDLKNINRKISIQCTKKNERSNKQPENGYQQQLNHPQINTINLLKGNIATQNKFKSNYCQKITLSNLQKYYQHCINKIKFKIVPQNNINNFNEQQKCNYISQSYKLSQRIKNNQNINYHNLDDQKIRPGYLSNIHNYKVKNMPVNQQFKKNLSFFCKRPKTLHTSRNYKSNKNNKIIQKYQAQEFKLEGWKLSQSNQQALI